MSKTKSLFNKVNSNPDFISKEKEILAFWDKEKIFSALVKKNAGNKRFSFIDGPITANNPMGVHHAWGRTYKDIFLRYHAMQGYDQRYQNGFDCQGLWVEVEVEKELGLNSKREIEAYGLANFSRKCRERVRKYSAIQSQQSMRLGQWMDWEHSYYTMTDTNIEYIWYFLKVCREKGWLYKGHRLMPWCVRCGTSLSQHELIDSYRDMTHKSVYLKLPIEGRPNEYMLVWTTTPWTLSSNTALAVHPELRYARVMQGNSIYYLSQGTLGCLRGDYQILDTLPGEKLVGLKYSGPFDELEAQAGIVHRIVPWDQVGESEGTGVVHIAPGCGAEDFELSKVHNLAIVTPIDENGIFLPKFGFLTGQSVMKIAEQIFENLEKKGKLYKTENYLHRYPVCWRCSEELVFTLVDEWFLRSDEIKPLMIEANKTVTWHPAYGGKRMEDWLNNMGDWCISRKRYWGLPLPFYQCDCGEFIQVGSRKELEALAIEGLEQLEELHRPWIDKVKIRCPKCGNPVTRVTEVGDCWLDAGIVPFSTLGYLESGHEYWKQWFPADFITEMREQIRLWFYSMLFMSVTLEGKAPYREVMVYEKALDEWGKPMHKSHGNAIWFDDAAEKMGADVMRWIYASQNLITNLRFGFGIADESRRKLLTLWNSYSFFVMYANIDGFNPKEHPLIIDRLGSLDRWILARLQELIVVSRAALDSYATVTVTHEAERFFDDLSNWYIRRSRRRFWKSENDHDKWTAYTTLYTVLETVNRILAPILPFLMEDLYQNLVCSVSSDVPQSVHLCTYPTSNKELENTELVVDMEVVKKIVEIGRSVRNRVQLKVRQPLSEMYILVPVPRERTVIQNHQEIILDELNIKKITLIDDKSQLVAEQIKLKYNVLGKKYGKTIKELENYLKNTSVDELIPRIKHGSVEIAEVLHNGQPVILQPDDVTIETRELENVAVAEDGPYLVALNTNLTTALIEEGMIREFVRQIQNIRKEKDFEITDTIRITYRGSSLINRAVESHVDYVKRETLAYAIIADGEQIVSEKYKIGDEDVYITVEKV